ncbi:MAG: YrdB family protein [Actinomycetota bacterium]|nr:YrdB family protein [Actinomycetota bacterium]
MTGREALRWANLTLAFVLELCALGALGYWGARTGGGPVAKTALGIGAPLLAAVLWGLFAAPRAPVSVPILGLGVKLVVFGSAASALYAAGHRALAAAFALLVVVNGILARP